jgi:hypothetical protein
MKIPLLRDLDLFALIRIVGFGIGVVVRSENSEVPAGKYIYGIAVRTSFNLFG